MGSLLRYADGVPWIGIGATLLTSLFNLLSLWALVFLVQAAFDD